MLPECSVRTVRLVRRATGGAGRLRVRPLRVWPLLLTLWPVTASALSVRTLTLEELVSRSHTIFVGRCVAVREVERAWAGLPATEAEFVVAELMKADTARHSSRSGALPGVARGVVGPPAEHVRVRQIGTRAVPGLETRFHVGQEVLLFLYGDSVMGLTSPVGMAQGVFTILRVAPGAGSDLAIRGSGPLRTTSIRALPQRTPDASGGPGAAAGSAVELDALLAAVRHLVDESR